MSDFSGSAAIRTIIALATALAGAAIAIATPMPGTPVTLSGGNMPGIVVAHGACLPMSAICVSPFGPLRTRQAA
ncbi:MAG TPA: hypothetical protein VGH36_13240 [Acetobacteraceae bacterium]|jgi:hypothetical protein